MEASNSDDEEGKQRTYIVGATPGAGFGVILSCVSAAMSYSNVLIITSNESNKDARAQEIEMNCPDISVIKNLANEDLNSMKNSTKVNVVIEAIKNVDASVVTEVEIEQKPSK